MVVAEYCQNSKDFTDYLDLREKVADADVMFSDELDLFAAFCQEELEDIISQQHKFVFGLAKMFDEDYNSEMLGVDLLKNNSGT